MKIINVTEYYSKTLYQKEKNTVYEYIVHKNEGSWTLFKNNE